MGSVKKFVFLVKNSSFPVRIDSVKFKIGIMNLFPQTRFLSLTFLSIHVLISFFNSPKKSVFLPLTIPQFHAYRHILLPAGKIYVDMIVNTIRRRLSSHIRLDITLTLLWSG